MALEILDRAAAGRIGRLATPHGAVTTPTLLPVVNPNIALVRPKEMRQHFGTEMVITNSYVIHKHPALRERALADGVHALLDWDGPVMTDSGTFQMYVYGDVEVAPDDIVRFQAATGVDVATCLDLFVTPEMDARSAAAAVQETLARTRDAVAHKGDSLLNATVQGGLHLELRKACAHSYRGIDVDYHTIGGVVPLMEQQRYGDLVDVILWSQQALRKDRPVHLFGAGHPLVFPLAVALGCDLFDSSSYAKYARDGRLLTPTATIRVADIVDADEWPLASRFLEAWTPKEVVEDLVTGREGRRERGGLSGRTGAMGAEEDSRTGGAGSGGDTAVAHHGEAERALALHNLDVCFADLRAIRRAIRDGVLWELVEQRAAAHPLLAAATRRLGSPEYQAWLEMREPVTASRALRYTGGLTHRRPLFARIRHRLATRFTSVGVPVPAAVATPYAAVGEEKREAALHKEPASRPYGDALGDALDPEQDHVVVCALGPVPLGLDEAYPFAQSVLPRLDGLDREHMGWVGETKDAFLAAHDFMPAIPGPPGPGGERVDRDLLQVLRTADWQFGAGAGLVLSGVVQADEMRRRLAAGGPRVAPGEPVARVPALRCERSRATGKLRTVHLRGEHILSLRAGDGLWTLKPAGARLLHAALPSPALRVTVQDDTAEFPRAGKSVFARFVTACDPGLRPGDECLVVDAADRLLALGRARLCGEEMQDFQSGVAVQVRDGYPVQTAPATSP